MGYVMKDQLAAIRADIDAALAGVATKHKLMSLKCGAGTYGASNFSLKVEGIAEGGSTAEAQRYEFNAKTMGLLPLGGTFTHGARMYKTTGINTTGTKCMVDRIPDGKSFLMPTHVVQQAQRELEEKRLAGAITVPKKRGAK